MAPDRGKAAGKGHPATWTSRHRKPPPSSSTTPSPGSSLISAYHALEKRLSQTKDPLLRKQIQREQVALGGLEKYQEWSVKGGDRQRGGETGKWLVKKLFELEGKKDFRLLDVGAIGGTAYSKYRFITPVSIDLNPLPSSSVLKQDFFDRPYPVSPEEAFDVVSLSLVLNFVGDLEARGKMLRRVHKFLRRRPAPEDGSLGTGKAEEATHDPTRGYLFLVLPLACTQNSRYLTPSRLTSILLTLGFSVVAQHDSPKLTYWLCQPHGDGKGDGKKWKKEEVRPGAKRNNFCIKV